VGCKRLRELALLDCHNSWPSSNWRPLRWTGRQRRPLLLLVPLLLGACGAWLLLRPGAPRAISSQGGACFYIDRPS